MRGIGGSGAYHVLGGGRGWQVVVRVGAANGQGDDEGHHKHSDYDHQDEEDDPVLLPPSGAAPFFRPILEDRWTGMHGPWDDWLHNDQGIGEQSSCLGIIRMRARAHERLRFLWRKTHSPLTKRNEQATELSVLLIFLHKKIRRIGNLVKIINDVCHIVL